MKRLAAGLLAILFIQTTLLRADLPPAPGEIVLELDIVNETMTAYANNAPPCDPDFPFTCGVTEQGVTIESPLGNLNLRTTTTTGFFTGLIFISSTSQYVEQFFLSTVPIDGTFDLTGLYNFNAGADAGLSLQLKDLFSDIFFAEIIIVDSLCDFNDDSLCDVTDMNLMFAKGDLVAGTPTFAGDLMDMNDDLVINQIDIDRWLDEAATENGYSSAYERGDSDDLGAIVTAQRDVDITDFNALASNFDPSGSNGSMNTWNFGNFDGDHDIDITDFNFLASNFAPSGYATQSIPEPQSLMLLGLALMACLAKRSREPSVTPDD